MKAVSPVGPVSTRSSFSRRFEEIIHKQAASRPAGLDGPPNICPAAGQNLTALVILRNGITTDERREEEGLCLKPPEPVGPSEAAAAARSGEGELSAVELELWAFF